MLLETEVREGMVGLKRVLLLTLIYVSVRSLRLWSLIFVVIKSLLVIAMIMMVASENHSQTVDFEDSNEYDSK